MLRFAAWKDKNRFSVLYFAEVELDHQLLELQNEKFFEISSVVALSL